jgi:RNA polymerase sigma factor (sigma-70 family)
MIENHHRLAFDHMRFSIQSCGTVSEMGAGPARSISDSWDQAVSREGLPTDSELFLKLSIPHIPVVRGLLRSLLRNDADVEETLQETLLHAFSNRHQLRIHESFRPWIIRIAMNEARKILRCKPCWLARYSADQPLHKGEHFVAETPDSCETPSELLEHGEIHALLKRTIAKLPTREREALLLCDIGGTTSAVAAKMLGVSKARVRTTLSRARAKLREELGPILKPAGYRYVMRENGSALERSVIL